MQWLDATNSGMNAKLIWDLAEGNFITTNIKTIKDHVIKQWKQLHTHKIKGISSIDGLIDINEMSTHLGIFYASMFILMFLRDFLRVFAHMLVRITSK